MIYNCNLNEAQILELLALCIEQEERCTYQKNRDGGPQKLKLRLFFLLMLNIFFILFFVSCGFWKYAEGPNDH